MFYAQLMAIIADVGKENVIGFTFDTSKRVHRRKINGVFETFDERFVISEALNCLIVKEIDLYGVEVTIHLPIPQIISVFSVNNPDDIRKVDFRYMLG
jgi:hypothetical protein